ncbi:hypothetical protein DFH06DRAFT_1145137 [Mycena polygramma]|nr:hypothetical protein DFH06DRAFT_1145137 [Mycena polygramma]
MSHSVLRTQRSSSNGRSGFTRGLPCTLGLSGPSLLPKAEENQFKLEIAYSVCNSKQAEQEVVDSLQAAARAAVVRYQAQCNVVQSREAHERAVAEAEATLAKNREAEAQALARSYEAEIRLAAVLQTEAQSRLRYYDRMHEVAANNVNDAEFQVGMVRHDIWVQNETTFAAEKEWMAKGRTSTQKVDREIENDAEARTLFKRNGHGRVTCLLFTVANEGNPAPLPSSSTRSKARRVRLLKPGAMAKKTYAAKAEAAKDKAYQRAHRKPLTPRQAVRVLREEVRELRAALARTEPERDAAQAAVTRVSRPKEGPGDPTERPRNLHNEPKLYTATWPDPYNCPADMIAGMSIFDYYDAIIYDDDPELEKFFKDWPRYQGNGPLAPSHSPDSSPSPNVSPSRNDGDSNNCATYENEQRKGAVADRGGVDRYLKGVVADRGGVDRRCSRTNGKRLQIVVFLQKGNHLGRVEGPRGVPDVEADGAVVGRKSEGVDLDTESRLIYFFQTRQSSRAANGADQYAILCTLQTTDVDECGFASSSVAGSFELASQEPCEVSSTTSNKDVEDALSTPPSQTDGPGKVYGLRVKHPDGSVVLKVGRSDDPQRRTIEWRCQCPEDVIDLLWEVPTEYAKKLGGSPIFAGRRKL